MGINWNKDSCTDTWYLRLTMCVVIARYDRRNCICYTENDSSGKKKTFLGLV